MNSHQEVKSGVPGSENQWYVDEHVIAYTAFKAKIPIG